MDDNKLDKLREIKYSLNKCCGLCKNAEFPYGTDWHTCKIHFYDHKKHNGGDKGSHRNLSINRFGCCGDFEWDELELSSLHHYKEFYE